MVTLTLAFSVAAFITVANNSGMFTPTSHSSTQTPTIAATNPPPISNHIIPPTTTPTNNPNLIIITHQGPITAQLNIAPNSNIQSDGCYLMIIGTVTNNSPNNINNVGLKVYCSATVFTTRQTVIDVAVPISSGDYNTATTYTLSSIAPHRSVDVSIRVYPGYQSQEPDLHGANVTLVLPS